MNNRRRMTGIVTSDKMTKTVVVEISRTYQHPLYKKTVHASSRFKAHNVIGAQMGDIVMIVESRPLSHDKRWVVEKIIRRQGEAAVTQLVVEDAAPVAEETAAAPTVAEEPAVEEPVVKKRAAKASAAEKAVAEAAAAQTAAAETAETEATGSETAESGEDKADTTTTETVEGE